MSLTHIVLLQKSKVSILIFLGLQLSRQLSISNYLRLIVAPTSPKILSLIFFCIDQVFLGWHEVGRFKRCLQLVSRLSTRNWISWTKIVMQCKHEVSIGPYEWSNIVRNEQKLFYHIESWLYCSFPIIQFLRLYLSFGCVIVSVPHYIANQKRDARHDS